MGENTPNGSKGMVGVLNWKILIGRRRYERKEVVFCYYYDVVSRSITTYNFLVVWCVDFLYIII